MNSNTSTSQQIGAAIFAVGAVYMFGLCWLYSWRVVPAVNQFGINALPGFLGFIWALSVPLGAFIVAIGAALHARVERRVLWLLVLLLLAAVVWRIVGTTDKMIPALFGIGGGLITVFFIGSVWNWAKTRPTLTGAGKTGSDLRMGGYIFFVVAAWDLCGIFGMANFVLRPELARYQLHLGHVMDRGPGAEAQWPHRDEDVWVHSPRPHPELQLATVVALVDFRRDNGATCVVPGSHRWPRDRVATAAETACAEMPASSAVIYLGSTIHGGGANTTGHEWRRGFHLSYTLGWLRTEENNMLAVPPSVARRLSPLARRIVGYGVHDAIADMGGYLGMLEMRDPAQMLDEGAL